MRKTHVSNITDESDSKQASELPPESHYQLQTTYLTLVTTLRFLFSGALLSSRTIKCPFIVGLRGLWCALLAPCIFLHRLQVAALYKIPVRIHFR